MGTNINRVVLTGNLTQEPELRSTQDGTGVCNLRLATNTRRKDPASGEWVDTPNYFDVVVWGVQGENVARYLSKGRPIAIDGRLEFGQAVARARPGSGRAARAAGNWNRPRAMRAERENTSPSGRMTPMTVPDNHARPLTCSRAHLAGAMAADVLVLPERCYGCGVLTRSIVGVLAPGDLTDDPDGFVHFETVAAPIAARVSAAELTHWGVWKIKTVAEPILAGGLPLQRLHRL